MPLVVNGNSGVQCVRHMRNGEHWQSTSCLQESSTLIQLMKILSLSSRTEFAVVGSRLVTAGEVGAAKDDKTNAGEGMLQIRMEHLAQVVPGCYTRHSRDRHQIPLDRLSPHHSRLSTRLEKRGSSGGLNMLQGLNKLSSRHSLRLSSSFQPCTGHHWAGGPVHALFRMKKKHRTALDFKSSRPTKEGKWITQSSGAQRCSDYDYYVLLHIGSCDVQSVDDDQGDRHDFVGAAVILERGRRQIDASKITDFGECDAKFGADMRTTDVWPTKTLNTV